MRAQVFAIAQDSTTHIRTNEYTHVQILTRYLLGYLLETQCQGKYSTVVDNFRLAFSGTGELMKAYAILCWLLVNAIQMRPLATCCGASYGSSQAASLAEAPPTA